MVVLAIFLYIRDAFFLFFRCFALIFIVKFFVNQNNNNYACVCMQVFVKGDKCFKKEPIFVKWLTINIVEQTKD